LGTIEALESASKAHPPNCSDIRNRFELACQRLRAKNKEIQESLRDVHEEMELLKGDLCRPKSELEEDTSVANVNELLHKSSRLRVLEMEEANKLRRYSRIKWLGEGDESSKYFFCLLKAKQKREYDVNT
jgi:hypothetical protein